jgi:signal transduction protein with GAF and PtsI domain
MQFIIDASPDAARWPAGSSLTLHETAQLLELDTAELLARTRSALMLCEQGFSLVILRQGQTSQEVEESSTCYDLGDSDVEYGRLMNALEEAQMALQSLQERLQGVCRREDREMVTTERMMRELEALERLCRERWQV